MKKISRRSFLALSGSAALLMAVNPLMANAAITEPELKSYYVAPFGESGTIQLDNSEHGTITIRPDTPIQGRANGDPVIHGTYTVEYNSIGSHFEYKVDTNSSYKITAAYDLDYTTVHEILSHSLTHTSTMASLKIEFKYFSVAGTANASSHFNCYLAFLSVFLASVVLSYQIVATYGFRLITTCLLFIIAFLYAPVEAKNKRLPTEKKRKYRHISICLTGFDVILAAIDILPLSRFITIYYFSKWALIIFAVIPCLTRKFQR